MEHKEKKEGYASARANQAADVSSKQIFGNHTLCAQFLRDYSGLELFANVQPEDIEDVSERYHLFRETELNADTVKKIRIRECAESIEVEPQDIYVVSLIEHKSAVDYDITMQILKYMVCIWENYVAEFERKEAKEEHGRQKKYKGINKRKSFRYPPIFPIVYYEGAGEWTAARYLKDRILLGDLFQTYIPNITYRLVRTRGYSNEELLANEDEISLVMLINKLQEPGAFHELSKISGERVNEIYQKAPRDVAEIIIAAVRSFCIKTNLPQDEADEIINNMEGGSMGNLFENMEKMDIQLERRRTEEQRQRAEEAEKRTEEVEKKAEQEKQNLYHILISTYRKQGMTKEDVKNRLVMELSLEEKETDNLLEKFWEE